MIDYVVVKESIVVNDEHEGAVICYKQMLVVLSTHLIILSLQT